MIKKLLSLLKKDKCTKLVMLWNGRQVQHWRLTDSEYKKLCNTTLPMGFSVISEMDI